MNKCDKVYNCIVDILVGHENEWSLKTLQQQVTWELGGELYITESIIRKAVARLPNFCITHQKNRRLVISARYFAPAKEVYVALSEINQTRYPETHDMHIPMYLEKIEDELRKRLILHKRGVWQTLQWAAHDKTRLELQSYYYGMGIYIK